MAGKLLCWLSGGAIGIATVCAVIIYGWGIDDILLKAVTALAIGAGVLFGALGFSDI